MRMIRELKYGMDRNLALECVTCSYAHSDQLGAPHPMKGADPKTSSGSIQTFQRLEIVA